MKHVGQVALWAVGTISGALLLAILTPIGQDINTNVLLRYADESTFWAWFIAATPIMLACAFVVCAALASEALDDIEDLWLLVTVFAFMTVFLLAAGMSLFAVWAIFTSQEPVWTYMQRNFV
ncbi:hypothetical protein [Rhodococcus sp. KRD175]|uniref:hypothetical protein n=1 Tax=Rhodococcus sp. KRD175 TaxID=2729729 RepID=UPI0019D2F235|nr:hypothetical protein [Rhodococcus sp. KRD175]